MKNLEELKNKHKEYTEIFEELRFTTIANFHEGMTEEEEEAENERASIEREKKYNLEEEYIQWKEDNDIIEECKEWSKEILGYIPWRDEQHEYKDWLTDTETFNSVIKSIEDVDEKEVEKLIENARKALESVGYTHDFDYYEVHDYIDYLEYINTGLRYNKDDGCMSILAMDILENRRLWVPYKEGFKECIEKVVAEIDSVFLHWE